MLKKLLILIIFLLYNIVISLFFFSLLFLSLFSKKTRKYFISSFKTLILSLKKNYKDTLWIHASSAGEIDQIVPIVERLNIKIQTKNKQRKDEQRIIVTHFSPSALYYKKVFKNLNIDFYTLPFDLPILRFFTLLKFKPKKIVFSRYDVWPGYIMLASLLNIELIAINLTIEKSSGRAKAFARLFFKFLYSLFSQVVFVSQQDRDLFFKLYKKDGKVLGDTRITRVQDRKKYIKAPLEKKGKTLVLGSIWQKDIDIIKTVIFDFLKDDNSRLIIAPHEPHEDFIKDLLKTFKSYDIKRYSAFNKRNDSLNNIGFKILILDTIGILFDFYSVADFVFVGGGFGVGVHSVLEPAVFGVPVAFGPNYMNSRDVPYLMPYKQVKSVKTAKDFSFFLNNFKQTNNTNFSVDINYILNLLEIS